MRTFEYCRNCQEYRVFVEYGYLLCSVCGEPLDNSEDDFSEDNTDNYEADDNDDLG